MQMSESYRPVSASFFAVTGISNDPGTRIISICSAVAPARRKASSAPESKRSVMKLLNWLTTIPKCIPVVFNSPRIVDGLNSPAI